MLVKEVARGDLAVSNIVYGLLEQGIKEAVNTKADIAAAWVGAGGITLSIGRLSIWNFGLIWVPLSKGKDFVIILHLLGNNCGSTALIILERDSHLSNVLSSH